MSRVLVVEDDADLQFLYDNALRRSGHQVAGARNSSDAIVYLTTDEFDLVILDINMPDMPGLKVLEFARDDVRLRHIPVIVVSANDQYRYEAQDLGAKYFLVKPVPLLDLLGVVAKALSG